jgi:hypothetical protein
MENIETALFDLSTRNSEFTEKQIKNVSKVIFTTAESSSKSSNNFDSQYNKYFPELNDLGIINDKFNPKFVIEFKNGKPLQEFTGWNPDIGILPNHRFMTKYYIDIGEEISGENSFMYCNIHKQKINFKCTTCQGSFPKYNKLCSCKTYIQPHQPPSLQFSCGCKCGDTQSSSHNNMGKYGFLHNIIHMNNMNNISYAPQNRNEDRPLIFTTKTIKFNVDNYLNLYHKESGLYLMFNKTTFPLFPFYNKKYIFQSKRLENITFEFNDDFYKSKDKRNELLEKINELIPSDYLNVYDYFNRFRMFPQYKTTLDLDEFKIIEYSSDNPKDRIIEELKTKLFFVIDKVNKSNGIIDNMIEEYSTNSVKIKELERELSNKDVEITTLKTENKEKIINEIEDLKVKLFNMNKVVLEKTNIELQKQALGKDVNNIKLELKTTTSKLNKMRDINNGMIEQIKQLKTTNKDLVEQNSFVTKEFTEIKCNYEKQNKVIQNYIKEIKYKESEYNKLLEQTLNQGKTSSNSLEQALSDQLDILKNEKDQITQKYNELIIEHKNTKLKLESITRTLGGLI